MLSVYMDEVVPKQSQPKKVADRLVRLGEWWAGKRLSEVTPATCRAYTAAGKPGGARRNLEDLRAAINYHARRELHSGYVEVELPQKGPARKKWLTRNEVARLLWVCWRHGRTVRLPRGSDSGKVVQSDYHDLRHLARFILMGVYTGSRSGSIFTASICAGANRSFVDLGSGIFYRLADGMRETSVSRPHQSRPASLPTCAAGETRGSSRSMSWNGRASP